MKQAALHLLLLTGVIALALAGCQRGGATSPAPIQRDFSGSLLSGGLTRTYQGHLPSAYDGTTPLPLLLALHGGGGDGAGMQRLTHLNQIADQHDFIVVYPDGYQKHWADGRDVTTAEQQGLDDVGFLSALIDALAGQYKIDRRRVYATGISNGGFMSERLACDLASKIVAIASDAATMSQVLAARCAPQRPVPFFLIQGEQDPIVPAQGGAVLGERGVALSASAAIQKWVQIDGCSGTAAAGSLPDTAHDGTQVSTQRYTGCQANTEIQAYLIAGGGHTWPGGLQYLPASIVGKTSRQFDAGQVIWQFLSQFSL
jgi:polyhydroxybutyrate depolymerase